MQQNYFKVKFVRLLSGDAWFVYHVRYLYTKSHLKLSPTEALQLKKVGEMVRCAQVIENVLPAEW